MLNPKHVFIKFLQRRTEKKTAPTFSVHHNYDCTPVEIVALPLCCVMTVRQSLEKCNLTPVCWFALSRLLPPKYKPAYWREIAEVHLCPTITNVSLSHFPYLTWRIWVRKLCKNDTF